MMIAADSTPSLREGVYGEAGLAVGLSLTEVELDRVRALIEEQWLARLRRCVHGGDVEEFARAGIGRYHELCERVDHATIWPKRERILPASAVTEIRRMPFVQRLQAELGEFDISDEDEVGWEEIYWRIVRPDEPGDMGPLHADRWFWDLGHGKTAPGVARIKVWVAVVCEPGRSGLRVVPGSHRRDWRYHGEQRHGMMKPQIDENEDDLGAVLVETRPGDVLVFHDKLLHGGALNRGRLTRVSFEFTMLVEPAS